MSVNDCLVPEACWVFRFNITGSTSRTQEDGWDKQFLIVTMSMNVGWGHLSRGMRSEERTAGLQGDREQKRLYASDWVHEAWCGGYMVKSGEPDIYTDGSWFTSGVPMSGMSLLQVATPTNTKERGKRGSAARTWQDVVWCPCHRFSVS